MIFGYSRSAGYGITNEKQRSTFQFSNATNFYYDPGYQVLLGIRGKF